MGNIVGQHSSDIRTDEGSRMNVPQNSPNAFYEWCLQRRRNQTRREAVNLYVLTTEYYVSVRRDTKSRTQRERYRQRKLLTLLFPKNVPPHGSFHVTFLDSCA